MRDIASGASARLKVLALIPARGGSKGLERKNLRMLAGDPLITWSIRVARACPSVDRVIVSTDDKEIADVARLYGAEVPFMRPPELAQDDTPDLPVCIHALESLQHHQSYTPDIIVWMRPTAPLRTVEDVEAAIKLLSESGADCVRSVCLAHEHPYWMKRLEDDHRLVPFLDGLDERTYPRRQLLPPAYHLNGAVDVFRRDSLARYGALYMGDVRGYLMPKERSIDIDSALDLLVAEALLKRRLE